MKTFRYTKSLKRFEELELILKEIKDKGIKKTTHRIEDVAKEMSVKLSNTSQSNSG